MNETEKRFNLNSKIEKNSRTSIKTKKVNVIDLLRETSIIVKLKLKQSTTESHGSFLVAVCARI